MALSTPRATLPLPYKFIFDSHLSHSPSSPPVFQRTPLFSSSYSQPKFNIISPITWRNMVSFFPGFLTRGRDSQSLKEELYQTIAPLDRGAEATPEDQQRVDQMKLKHAYCIIARKLEAVNSVKEPLKSDLLNGKWELLYTTSQSVLQTQATANLVPLNSRRVAVKFDFFKIASLIPIKSPGSGRGQLEITYLDEDLRISRGDRGDLFILKTVEPSYGVPL